VETLLTLLSALVFLAFPEMLLKNLLLIPHAVMDRRIDGRKEKIIPFVLLRVVPPGDSLKYKIIRAKIRATNTMCLDE